MLVHVNRDSKLVKIRGRAEGVFEKREGCVFLPKEFYKKYEEILDKMEGYVHGLDNEDLDEHTPDDEISSTLIEIVSVEDCTFEDVLLTSSTFEDNLVGDLEECILDNLMNHKDYGYIQESLDIFFHIINVLRNSIYTISEVFEDILGGKDLLIGEH